MGGWRNWRGDELKQLTLKAVLRAIEKTGNVILAETKKEVPLREGTLERSGIFIMAANNIPNGCISYGGGSGTGFPIVPYAIKWHELDANFQRGRKRFYVRDPFVRLVKVTLERAIAIEMRNFL